MDRVNSGVVQRIKVNVPYTKYPSTSKQRYLEFLLISNCFFGRFGKYFE